MYTVTLLLHLSAATGADLKSGRIPNGIIASGILCGFAGSVLTEKGQGGMNSLGGMMVPVLMTGWLYCFRMIGAGDIKLLCMAGSFSGVRMSFQTVLYSFLIGGLLSAALLVHRGNLHSRFQYFLEYLYRSIRTGRPLPYLEGVGEDGRFCFSLPVLLACILLQVRK